MVIVQLGKESVHDGSSVWEGESIAAAGSVWFRNGVDKNWISDYSIWITSMVGRLEDRSWNSSRNGQCFCMCG